MKKKNYDPFGFNKAINWDKLNDPEILKELEKIFGEFKQQFKKLEETKNENK